MPTEKHKPDDEFCVRLRKHEAKGDFTMRLWAAISNWLSVYKFECATNGECSKRYCRMASEEVPKDTSVSQWFSASTML